MDGLAAALVARKAASDSSNFTIQNAALPVNHPNPEALSILWKCGKHARR